MFVVGDVLVSIFRKGFRVPLQLFLPAVDDFIDCLLAQLVPHF